MSDAEGNHRKLVAFISGELARTEGRQCILLELVSARLGSGGITIRTWDRREDPALFDGIGNTEDLTTQIIRIAEDYAESSGGGAHRFELKTQQHLGGRQRTAFSVHVESNSDEATGGDAPTEKGLVGQLMRHTEMFVRQNAATFQVTLGSMARQISDLTEECRALRKERNDHLNELEEAKSEQNERDLEAMRQMSSDKRKDAAFERILSFLPMVASRMIGGGESGAANKESSMAILANELFDSFEQAQFVKLASVLNPNQQMLLAEIVNAARKHKAEAQAAQAQSSTGQQVNGQAIATQATG